jgi:hypothetical protein
MAARNNNAETNTDYLARTPKKVVPTITDDTYIKYKNLPVYLLPNIEINTGLESNLVLERVLQSSSDLVDPAILSKIKSKNSVFTIRNPETVNFKSFIP